MPFNDLRNCDDKYRTANKNGETYKHLWPKVEFDRRKMNEERPYFVGIYYFEKKLMGRVPDVINVGDMNRWFEFVAGSEQDYEAKTRQALRIGYKIYWVFHIDYKHEMFKAKDELHPYLHTPISFGVYDPVEGTIKLGDPISLSNYDFIVRDMDEFKPNEIEGYRGGSIGRESRGFDLGTFLISGDYYRLLSGDKRGNYLGSQAPGQTELENLWDWPSEEVLHRYVTMGEVERVGPAKSHLPHCRS